METADQLDELKRAEEGGKAEEMNKAEEMKNFRSSGACCGFSCGGVRADVEKVPETSAAKKEASWRLVLACAKKAAEAAAAEKAKKKKKLTPEDASSLSYMASSMLLAQWQKPKEKKDKKGK